MGDEPNVTHRHFYESQREQDAEFQRKIDRLATTREVWIAMAVCSVISATGSLFIPGGPQTVRAALTFWL
jgi:hypothetical protein